MFWFIVGLIALGWVLGVAAAIAYRVPRLTRPEIDELAARRARKEQTDAADPPSVAPGSGATDGTEGA